MNEFSNLPGFKPLQKQVASAPGPSFTETLDAAFALNNEIYSAYGVLSRQSRPAPEPEFNLGQAFAESGLSPELGQEFYGVQSSAEFAQRRQRLETAQRQRQTLESAGGVGIAAGIAAGFFSPTLFIPLVGAARGARGVSQVFKLAAGAAGGQELALQATVEGREFSETLTNIGIGTIVGGLLGSTVLRQISKAERAALTASFETDPLGLALRMAPAGSAGAMSNQVVDPGRIANATRLGRWLAGIGPITRGIEQGYSTTARWMTAQFGTGGLELEGAARGVAAARGGTLEALQHQRGVMIADARYMLDDAYAKHVYGEASTATRAQSRLRGLAPSTETTLSRGDFEIEVSRALRSGDKHPIPAVESAAQYLRQNVYAPLEKELKELGMIPEDAKLIGAESYLNRIYNPVAISRNFNQFVEVVAKHIGQKMRLGAIDQAKKAEEKIARSEQAIEDLSADAAEQRVRRDMLGERKKELEADPMSELADEISFYRSFARELEGRGKEARRDLEKLRRQAGTPVDRPESVRPFDEYFEQVTPEELRKHAKELEEQGGERYKQFVKERAEVNRRLSNLSKSFGQMEIDRRRALERLDKIEDQNLTTLRRLINKGRKVFIGLERASDENLDKEIAKVRKLLLESDAMFQQNAKRLLELESKLPQGFSELVTAGDVIATIKQLDVLENLIPEGVAFSKAGKGKVRLEINNNAQRDTIMAAIERARTDPTVSKSLKTSLTELETQLSRIQVEDAADASQLFARFQKGQDQLQSRLDRLQRLEDRLFAGENLDREALRREIQAILDEALDKSNKIISARAVRANKIQQRADGLSDRVKKEIESHQKKIAEGRVALEKTASASRSDPFDFSLEAEEIAAFYANRISNGPFMLTDMPEQIGGLRGPELARMLDVPDQELEPFLENNIDTVMTNYIRAVGTDVELTRRFGSVNPEDMFRKIQDEFNESRRKVEQGFKYDRNLGEWVKIKDETKLAARQQKELDRIAKAERQAFDDLKVLFARLRHQRGRPETPDGLMYRLGKTVMDLNALRMMGTVVLSSVPDMAMPVLKFGLGRTLRDGLAPMFTNWQALRMSQREAQYAGTALDVILNTRANSIADIYDDARRGSLPERGINLLAQRMGNVPGLFNYWTATMKQFTAGIANGKLMDSIAAVMGENSAIDVADATRFLASKGIDGEIAARIWKQKGLGHINNVDGLWLPNTADWTDMQAVRAYRSALLDSVDSTIITPGLERPNFVDSNIGWRMIMQFRSFALSATTRMFMAGLQQRDMAVLQGTALMLALGAASYYTWAISVGGKAEQEMRNAGFDKWMDEAISRSGLTAVFGEVQRISEYIPGARLTFSEQTTTRRQAGDILGALLGPSYDFATKAFTVAQGISDPTQSTLTTASKLIPYQNVFYLRQALDSFERAVGEAAGLPEKRGST